MVSLALEPLNPERVETGLSFNKVAVVAGVADGNIVAIAEQRNVVAAAAGDDVVAVAADQHVVAAAAGDRVIAGTTIRSSG